MRTVRESLIVEAKPEAVWEVLVEPYYTPKLYPDILNIVIDPPGRAVVGQKHTLSGKAGKRMIEFRTEVSGLVPYKRYELRGREGGAFEEFSEVLELSPVKGGTELKCTWVFKVSEDYFGPAFDVPTLEQMAVRNQEVYIHNLKNLAELKKVT
ncbi:MAG: SRPBCC family protein [Nitrososphaerota archaeon]|nr:SRPBCC family protein [Nitrososphaerota archaeon]